MVEFPCAFLKYGSIAKKRQTVYHNGSRIRERVYTMELPIGKMIFSLRKKNGITQEQLANAVGVSIPAVSKWETGNSYPDITLLIPIARYLGVTVDELLHYESEITPEKVLEIEKECTEKFESDGFDPGLSLCDDYLKEYPNNLYLKYRLSGLLPWYAAKCGVNDETARAAVEKAAGLLKEAGESKEDKIRSASRYLLACTYLQMDKSKEAQDILEAMPAEEVDPKKMLPTVYLQRGEFDKAMKLNQQNLFEGVQSAAMALTGLASIAMRQKKWDDALRYADAQRKLIEAFGLDDFMMSSNCQLYLLIYSRRKDAERTLKYLKQYVSVFPYDVSTLRLSDNFFFSMAETKEPSVMLNFTKETVVRELKQNKDFDFLRGDARFQSLLESFQN